MGYVSHLSCSSVARIIRRIGDELVRARRPAIPGGARSGAAEAPNADATAGGIPTARPLAVRRALPLDADDPDGLLAHRHSGRGMHTLPALCASGGRSLGCRLEVKDEGKHYAGFGANPTLSFKDRGMAMTVSMARSLGLDRLAVPTQGNAGDSLAEYAVAAGIEAVIVMSPDTDLPVLGKVAAYAQLYPEHVKLELVAGTIIDCGKRIREQYVPQGYFSVATFQEPGWRTEGKKTLGLEMAEPAGDRLAERRWQLPDVIVYPTGGGTGVVGMAKAFDELEAWVWSGPSGPGWSASRATASTPIVRAFDAGAADIEPRPPGRTIATGLERGAEHRAHQRPANHPRDRWLRGRGLRGGDPRGHPRRVARAAVRLVARGGRDTRRPSRAGRPRHRSVPTTESCWSTPPRPRNTSRRSVRSWTAVFDRRTWLGRLTSTFVGHPARRRPWIPDLGLGRDRLRGQPAEAEDISKDFLGLRRGQGIASIRAMVSSTDTSMRFISIWLSSMIAKPARVAVAR